MEKKNVLGVLKGAIQTQEGNLIESTDENVLKVIKTFEKSIKQTIEAKVKLDESTFEQEMELSYLEKQELEFGILASNSGIFHWLFCVLCGLGTQLFAQTLV
jgi:hypothetical protein